MKFQLKQGEPDRVEVGLGTRVYICERSEGPFESRPDDWPALEKTGHFELVEEPENQEEDGQQENQQENQQDSQQDAIAAQEAIQEAAETAAKASRKAKTR